MADKKLEEHANAILEDSDRTSFDFSQGDRLARDVANEQGLTVVEQVVRGRESQTRTWTVIDPETGDSATVRKFDTLEYDPNDPMPVGTETTVYEPGKAPVESEQVGNFDENEPSEWDRTEDYERMQEENRSTEQPELPESPDETETPSDVPSEEPQPAEEPPPEEKPKKEEKPKDAKDDCGYCVPKPPELKVGTLFGYEISFSGIPMIGDFYSNAGDGLHYLTHGIFEGNIFKTLLGVEKLIEAGMDLLAINALRKHGVKKLLIEIAKKIGVRLEAEAIRLAIHEIIDGTDLSDEQKEDAKEVADILVDEFLDDFKEIVKLPSGKRLNSVLGNVTPHNRKIHRHPDYPYSTEQKLRLMGIDVTSHSGVSTREISMNFESNLPLAYAGTNA